MVKVRAKFWNTDFWEVSERERRVRMRKLERARRFDNFFNLLLLFCFCFFPPPKKSHHLAPEWAAAVLKEFLVFVVERRRKNKVRQESRESTFLSLFSTRKKKR